MSLTPAVPPAAHPLRPPAPACNPLPRIQLFSVAFHLFQEHLLRAQIFGHSHRCCRCNALYAFMSASVLTQVASCALMCVLGAALAFASKKSSSNGSDLNYASIVLISEIVKFLVACSLFVFDTRSSSSSLCAALFRRPFVTSALPSMFFAFQNNVAHLAHRSTNPITFQLIMNSRSFAVAVLQVGLLSLLHSP